MEFTKNQRRHKVKKHLFLIVILFLSATTAMVSAITAEEIIKKVDDNMVSPTQKFKARMVIKKDNRELIKTYEGYGQEEGEKFFFRFTNSEDLGVKYLKIEDELWIYFPDADDVMKISGHMLRQGMMGSDISYEDIMDLDKLREKYDSELMAEETYKDTPVYSMKLTAKADDVTYYRQDLKIDKEKFIVLKMDLYAKSGRLLKTFENSKIKKYGEKYYPTRMVVSDKRKEDSSTTMEFLEIEFDVDIPDGTFTRQNLYR